MTSAVTGHDLARIPRDLHGACYPALRRVYVAGRDADAGETARELDNLYARVAELQEGVQQARQKEQSAEGRVAAIMDLWKKEQVKVADLQQRLQHALMAQQSMQAVKHEPRPSPPTTFLSTSAALGMAHVHWPSAVVAPGSTAPRRG